VFEFVRRACGGWANLSLVDLLRRDFAPTAPDLAWVGDITYIKTFTSWAYLATVIDCFSRRVVGWAIAEHMRTDLITDAFRMAITTRNPPPGVIFHSDHGSRVPPGHRGGEGGHRAVVEGRLDVGDHRRTDDPVGRLVGTAPSVWPLTKLSTPMCDGPNVVPNEFLVDREVLGVVPHGCGSSDGSESGVAATVWAVSLGSVRAPSRYVRGWRDPNVARSPMEVLRTRGGGRGV
jgi:hypothetical protein